MNETETVVVFDTETTGLLEYRKRHRDPSQPALIQIAAALYQTPTGEDKWERIGVLYGICDRDGVPIHPKAFAQHGITEEQCDLYGLNTENMLYVLMGMLEQADVQVAHNRVFDVKVLKCNMYRHTEASSEDVDNILSDEKGYCTMLRATDIVKAAKKRGKGYKWPSLEECSQYFFGKGVENAHDALADVDVCAQVYFELRRRGL